MITKALSILCMASLMVAGAGSQTVAADFLQELNTKAGIAVRAGYFWRIYGCNRTIETTIRLVKKPKNGRVAVQDWSGKLNKDHRDFQDCGPIDLFGKEVIYVPNDGYIGVDSFEVRRSDNRPSRAINETIQYKVTIK